MRRMQTLFVFPAANKLKTNFSKANYSVPLAKYWKRNRGRVFALRVFRRFGAKKLWMYVCNLICSKVPPGLTNDLR